MNLLQPIIFEEAQAEKADWTVTIIIIVVSLLALGGLFVLLYFTLIRSKHYSVQIGELRSHYENMNATLNGQDDQYIKRIEHISDINLTFSDQYSKWKKKFDEIRDYYDAPSCKAIKDVEALYDDKRWVELKKEMPKAKKTLDEYQDAIDAFDAGLKQFFRVEEETNEKVYAAKDSIRCAKDIYFNKRKDLGLVASSFEKAFDTLDTALKDVDDDTDSAKYDDARIAIDTKIRPAVDALCNVLERLPDVCVKIESLIPDRITSVKNKYQEMVQDGYPLAHIMNMKDFKAVEARLKEAAESAKNFEYREAKRIVEEIESKISAYSDALAKEVSDRTDYETNYAAVYKEQEMVERSFIALCNKMPEVKRIYQIKEEDEAKVKDINALVSKAGSAKRTLDASIQSLSQQPFSMIVDKMNNLSKCTKEASDAASEFRSFLNALRESVESAHDARSRYYLTAKELETKIRSLNSKPVAANYAARIDSVYAHIDAIDGILSAMPIDVDAVRAEYQALVEEGDACKEEIEAIMANAKEAEATIVAANHYRANSGIIAGLLEQSEKSFKEGDFSKSLELAGQALDQAKNFN